jgi:DNA-binding transcriptional regulator GbsR (MarR family)
MSGMPSSSSYGPRGAGRVRRAAPPAGSPDSASSGADDGADWRQAFVDDFCELDLLPGMSRASMRVLGWMVVCRPGPRSAQQIMEELRLSAGSVSAAVNALHDHGLLERVVREGDRHVYYRLRTQGWEHVLAARCHTFGEVRRAADRALRASHGEADQRVRDLREVFGRVELGLTEILRQGDDPGVTRTERAWNAGLMRTRRDT